MRANWEARWGEYEDHMRAREASKRTIATKRWNIERFFSFLEELGIRELWEVDLSVLERYRQARYGYVNRYGRPDGPLTQMKYIEAVRGFFKYLEKTGKLAQDPAADFQYPRAPKRLPKDALTHEEMKKLLRQPDVGTLTGFRDRTIIEVFYSTGLRLGEFQRLELGDVDLEGGTVFVRLGKGKKDRVVPLGRIACLFLENYRHGIRPLLVCPWSGEVLFLSTRGNPLSDTRVAQMLVDYATAAGIEKRVSPHTLRRTFATALFRGGAKAAHVKDMMGHENFESLSAYLRLTILDLKEAHSKYHPREMDPGAKEARRNDDEPEE